MKIVPLLMLVFVSFAIGCGKTPTVTGPTATPSPTHQPTPQEIATATDAIKELGGGVREWSSKKLSISLATTKVTDDDLTILDEIASLVESLYLNDTQVSDVGLVHLKKMTRLRNLTLHNTKITDTGLVHLEGLTNLSWLQLNDTKITDAGIVHLKGLTNLKTLLLNNTKVTDAGLVHLKRLTKLRQLTLDSTEVSEAGVKELKSALPNCQIERWQHRSQYND